MIKFKIIWIVLICTISFNAQAQWKKADGKFASSNVTNFVSVDSLIYAGTSKNGIIISDNKGKSWEKNIPTNYPLTWLYNFDGILIGFFGHEHTFITCSKDRGVTWEEIPTDTLFNNISKFIYSLTFHNHEIYITNGKGIFKTGDWGKTWKLVSNKFGYQSKIVSYGSYLYISNKKTGIWYSNNNGRTWVKEEIVQNNSLVFQIVNNKLITGYNGFIYKLNTPGGTWEKVFKTNVGMLLRIAPFCCSSYIIPGISIVFRDGNIVTLPKVPIPYEYMIANAMINKESIITVSFSNHDIWNLEYKLNLEY